MKPQTSSPVVVWMLAALLLGHTAQAADPPLAFSPVPPPAAVHLDRERSLEETLGDLVPALQEEFSVPGAAVGLLRGGVVVYEVGFGLANVEGKVPVTPVTLFNVGSISKPIAAGARLEAGGQDEFFFARGSGYLPN